MIDLKRNSKKEFVEATGKRKRNIYEPLQSADFKISRSKFSDYLTCQRCFFLDRVGGLEVPGTPGWTLNETTDLLLKKEFDECREAQKPHRIFNQYNLNHIVPFNHPDMNKWRDSLRHGLMARFKSTNIILTGGVDDIWLNTKNNKLIIVDYKSQAKNIEITDDNYLSDVYHKGYKLQMDFYAYLLMAMGFEVDATSYFYVCNANRGKENFMGKMEFDEYLISYEWDADWIDGNVEAMIRLMNQYEPPNPNPSCKNCAYSQQYSKFL